MKTYDEELRRQVEQAYLAGGETVVAIAERFAIKPGLVHAWRARFGWPSRRRRRRKVRKRPGSPARAAPASPAPHPTLTVDPTVAGRLMALIIRKLEQLEASMSNTDPPEPADLERETRAIGTLIKNLEQVSALETDRRRAEDARGGTPTPGPGVYDNEKAESKRRALAERLERIRERARPGPAGGDN